jgi:hypothetical protein
MYNLSKSPFSFPSSDASGTRPMEKRVAIRITLGFPILLDLSRELFIGA